MNLRLTFILTVFAYCFFPNLEAQENAFVYGSEVLCPGECGEWFVEFPISDNFIYNWQFYDANNNADPVWEVVTEGYEPINNCQYGFFDFFPGNQYLIELVVLTFDGAEVAAGEFVFWVDFEQEVFGDAFGMYTSACEQDSFSLSFPNQPPLCREVCSGSTSTLTLEQIFGYSPNGNTYVLDGSQGDWSVIGGTFTTAGTGIEVVWTGEGNGLITFVFTANTGCDQIGFIDFCFEIIPAPEAGFSTQPPANDNGIVEVCEGQPVFFFAETTDAESYLWDFGDGGASSIANPIHVFSTAGTYEVELITSTSCECTDTSRVTVLVEGNETPFVDCIGTICEGTSVTYTANTGCTNYVWTISGNGTILDGGSTADDFITIEWGAGPIGEITLETDGCPDLSACTTAAYLQVPIVSTTTTIDGPLQVCPGDESVYSVPPFEGTSFTWSVGSFGTIVAGQGSPSITVEWFDGFIPNEAQPVTVDYSNCYLGCGGSAAVDVRILPEFYLTGEIEACAGTTENYAVISTQSGLGFPATYNVLNSNGTTIWSSPGAASTVDIDWTFGPGEYTVVAIPENPLDFCLLNATMAVLVLPEPDPVAAVDGQTDICPGIAYAYSVVDPVEGERYRWSVTNGTDISQREGTSIAVEWGTSGPYSLSVQRLSPPLFCASVPTTLTIGTVSSFSIVGDDQVCMDQLASYTSDQMGDVYYEWSILPADAGTITEDPTAATVEILWHNAGPATVLLDICGQQEVFNVTVNAPPNPVVNFPAALCPDILEVVSTTTPYTVYAWQDEEGNLLSTSPTPDLGGGYYRLEVTDDLGCVGTTTFQIYEYPSSTISISTPDFNLFCNTPPFTRLYAVNTEDGYTYQWYQNGSVIAGETGTNYVAQAFGDYYVEIVDENGCSFTSNTISVAGNCTDIRCNAAGTGCPNAQHTFTTVENGTCDNRSYVALANGSIPGTVFWNFDDPDSGAANNATGVNVSHSFTKPGFYRVLMGAMYDDGQGGQALCRTILPDTIYAVADFDYDGVCLGAPVQFYDLSTFLDLTNIVAWNWDFGDPASGASNSATDKDPIHIFSGDGDYQVTLTVTTGTGCTATVTKTVSIFPLPFTEFAEPDITCEATAIPFVANVEATVSDVSWSFGDPTSGNADTSTLFNSFHQYATVGSYSVTLDATSVYGCENSFSSTINITPNTLAGQIDPPGLSAICEGDDITLHAPTGDAIDWTWSNEETISSITVSTAEVYSVTLTSTEGCSYTPDAALVDVIPAPQAPIRSVNYDDFGQPSSYQYEVLTICFGEDAFLETEQQAGYTYSWSTGDFSNTTELTEDRGNLLPAGEHVITLTITDVATSCSATESFMIIVHPAPQLPVLQAPSGSLCAGTATTISVASPQGDLIYIWSNGEAGPSITTDEAGTYYVTAINSNGCRVESDPIEVLEGPDINLVPSGCHTRCAPDTLCLPNIPNVVSFQWYQDGVLIPAPEGTIGELVIEQSGSYTLEMEDVNGCVQTTEPLVIDILPGFGTLQGMVYYDLNNNEQIDAADSLAGDITIVLDNPNATVGTITTLVDGNYGFIAVPEDDYTLSVDEASVPENWTPLVASVDTTFQGCDQEVILDWLLVPDCSFDTTVVTSICPDEVFEFAGEQYPVGTNTAVNLSNTPGCDSIFTVTVSALPSSAEILGITVCEGETYSYEGQVFGPGADQIFTYENSAGCDSTVQLQVVEATPATFSLEALPSCPGESSGSLTIAPDAGQDPLVYAVDGGAFQTTGVFTALAPGTYELTVEDDNGCQYTEDFNIEVLPSLVVEIRSLMLPCDSSSVQLQPQVLSGDDGQLQYTWSDGATTLARPVSIPGSYVLNIANACEQLQLPAEVTPEFEPVGDLIFVPNVFSPNNDGANDEFHFYRNTYVDVQGINFRVFDRWGAQIFEAKDGADSWDGRVRGQKAPSGVYVWHLEADANICGEQRRLVQQGEVLLLR